MIPLRAWLKVLLAVGGLCLTIFGPLLGPASAAITYQYYPPIIDPGYIFDFFPATLTVTDAAVASGSYSFELNGICHNGGGLSCLPYNGDPSGFVSITLSRRFQETVTTADHYGLEIINVTFNRDGTLGGSVFAGSQDTNLNVSGGEFRWSGNWSSDLQGCPDQSISSGTQGGCLDPGYWFTSQSLPDPIPEPASIWLFGCGLLALLLCLAASRKPALLS